MDKIRQKMLIGNPPSFPSASDFWIHWLAKPNLSPAFHILYGLIIAEDNLLARHTMSAHNGQTADGTAACAPRGPVRRGGAEATEATMWPVVGTGQSGCKELSKHSPSPLSGSQAPGSRFLLSTHLGPCCNAGACRCTQPLCCKPVSCGHKKDAISQPF